jgi:hypothetical protein
VPLSLDDARRLVAGFVDVSNHVRLHSAIGYVAPFNRLAGREKEIFATRALMLAAARDDRETHQASLADSKVRFTILILNRAVLALSALLPGRRTNSAFVPQCG